MSLKATKLLPEITKLSLSASLYFLFSPSAQPGGTDGFTEDIELPNLSSLVKNHFQQKPSLSFTLEFLIHFLFPDFPQRGIILLSDSTYV